jgi:hypothetical protein
MKNKWKLVWAFGLLFIMVFGSNACGSTSIVGYWQNTEKTTEYLEFLEDGKVIYDNGGAVITGSYEIVSNNYVKVNFGGLSGALIALFNADTWQYEVSRNELTLQTGGKSSTYKKVRR